MRYAHLEIGKIIMRIQIFSLGGREASEERQTVAGRVTTIVLHLRLEP